MTRLRPRDYRELLRSGRWFAALPDALQSQLLDAAVIRHAGAGEHVFARGDDASGLFAVVDGAVRVSGQSEAGREVLHMVFEPPSWFRGRDQAGVRRDRDHRYSRVERGGVARDREIQELSRGGGIVSAD